MKKLVLIDGNSIMNRAFYGIMGSKALTTKDGKYTNAIYGFLAILFKLLEEETPEYIAVAFDLKAPTARHKLYEGYKANRKGMPEELAEQMPIIKEILRAMNIDIIEKEGYEGDDIIGTLSRYGENQGLEVTILSGDRDTFQLATDKVTIKIPRTKAGKTETELFDREKVKEVYGIEPKQLIEVKGLQGDTSDNIPGVPGIGEKTALSLIQKYGNIDNIYEKLEKGEFKGEKGDQGEKGEKGEKGESGEIATAENAGIVKPDGETITIDPDGTIHGQSVGKNPLTKVYFNYGSYFPGSSFEESAQILAGYDLICCEGSISGWTDSEKRQNEMALVQEVRRRNPKVKFFRYISVKNKYDATSKTRVPINKYDLYQQIRATLHMGGTWTTDKDEDGYEIVTGGIPYDGIFWDDFDSLSGVTELNDGDEQSWESVLEKQNDVIEEARRFGLCSFGNAWHVIELVSGKPIDNEPYYNPKSLKSSIGENDYLMVESCEFYPKEPIDGFGYWSGEDSSYKVYNYMKNYYPTQKANLVCFSSGGYSMTVEEKQCALTWMLMDLLVMGGRYVCFDQGLIYDMPEALKAFYYDDLSDATITRVASGHYQMRVNGHTIITKRESGLANSKATSNSFKLAHIWIDGVEIKNLFAQAPSIAFAMSEQIEEVNTRLDTLAPDIKKNVSRYHRLMIDDWIPTREPGAYPNLVPSSNGSGNGISITSRSGYDMEGSVQNGWGSYRWTIDATAYRGKTLEIGCSKFTLSATNKASIGIVIYDAQTWSNRQTIYTTTNNESDVGNGSGLNIKYTVSEAQNTIMFGFWGFGAAADDFFSVDDFYVIDPTSMEELLSKSDYTNRSIGFDSWVDSVSWKRPDDLTTLPYTITADKNDITIEYKEDGYAAYKGICVVMQTAGTLTPGSTWEIGCESFISNAEDNIRVRAYVYALAGWSPYIIPSKVDQSALHDVKCPHVTVTVPETAKDAKGCYIEILNLSATPYNTLSDGTKEAHKAVIKGFYMCDVNEENVIIRGLTPANTWLQICRVKDSVLAKDAKMISNALYITDSGKMFITDFSGNKIDIVKE